VTTARTVVHIVVVHQRRLLADDVLWLNYLISIHNFLFVSERNLNNMNNFFRNKNNIII